MFLRHYCFGVACLNHLCPRQHRVRVLPVLGADDPEEYMNILEDEIAKREEPTSYYEDDNKPHKSLSYKTSFSVDVDGVNEFINLAMGFKSYKAFHKFADKQNIPLASEVKDLRSQIAKLYPLEKIIINEPNSLFIVPAIDFNLSNHFNLNSEFDISNLGGKVNILSFLMASIVKQWPDNGYIQKLTNQGHYFQSKDAPVKTIYIFNSVFRKETKKPLEDYIKQLRSDYGYDVRIVLMALTEAQSNPVHFRLNAEDMDK